VCVCIQILCTISVSKSLLRPYVQCRVTEQSSTTIRCPRCPETRTSRRALSRHIKWHSKTGCLVGSPVRKAMIKDTVKCSSASGVRVVPRRHISKVYMKIATEALLDQSQAALHDDALLPARSPADCRLLSSSWPCCFVLMVFVRSSS